jgi:UDP-N-acetyl-D-mannosaminuronate dehydrogenase
VLEGTVVGLVAFVAAVLGVGYLHLPAAIAATEAGAFLTSVLCGFVGVAVFTALIDRLNAGSEK